MKSERIVGPALEYGPTLKEDRVGMTAEELCDRGEKAFKDLLEEVDRLHRHLPRKLDPRIRGLDANRAIVRECFKGARAKAKLARRSLEGGRGR